MKTSFKRTMVFVLALVMGLSLLAGCGGQENNTGPSGTTGAGTTTSAETAAPSVTWENAPVVKVMIRDVTSAQRTAANQDEVDNPYSRYLFEKTGIKVVVERQVGEGTQYDEKVYLTLASGNAPDLMFLGGNDQFCMKIARSGALSTINDYFGKYPNLNKLYNDDYWEEYSFDQNKYMLKGININRLAMRCSLIRQDWLDKLQLKMPATVDELYDTVKAFMAAKPDGQPVVGLTGRSNFSYFYTLSTAYGCPNYDVQLGYWFIDKAAKKLVFWNSTDAARAYFAQAAKWYKEGLIDPELVTSQGANFWDKIDNGKVGVISYRADASGWITTEIRQAQKRPEPTMVVMSPLGGTGFKDQFGKEGTLEADQSYESYFGIPRNNKNVDNVLKLLDFQASPEFVDFAIFGIEGIEHKVVDGKKVFDKENSNKVSYAGDYIYLCDRASITPEQREAMDIDASGGGDATYDPLEQALARNTAAFQAAEAISVPRQVFAATIPLLDEESQYPDIQSNYRSLYIKLIIGEIDAGTDAGWQSYLKALDDIGVTTVTKAKEAYLLKNKPELFN